MGRYDLRDKVCGLRVEKMAAARWCGYRVERVHQLILPGTTDTFGVLIGLMFAAKC